jgi:hypothetical protein
VARLVHLNGPPGIGKPTLSALYVDQNPGSLNLDVDILHRLVGGWQDEEITAFAELAREHGRPSAMV